MTFEARSWPRGYSAMGMVSNVETGSLSKTIAAPSSGSSVGDNPGETYDRAGHDRRYALNNRKIQLAVGFTPRESVETGLRRTLAWYLGHWWRRVMDGSYREWMRKQYGTIVSF
jgi:dTDP-D-glucose 4,6-dehydratase